MPPGNPTKPNTSTPTTHEDQARTVLAKQDFLRWWERTRGIVSYCCEKVEINRWTFYEWKRTDAAFAEALQQVEIRRNDEIEDLLMGKIYLEKDGPSIRFYLERTHDKYKQRSKVDMNITGAKTFEETLREAAIERAQQKKYGDIGHGEVPGNGGRNTGVSSE